MSIFLWVFSALLDLFDGMLARKLNQTSVLGIYLDIAADNFLRTCVWVAASNESTLMLVSFVISIEWVTMVCTQLHAAKAEAHWKDQRQHDPWIIREVFRNNFKSPLGMLSIYGLFASNMFLYGSQHPVLYENIPFFAFWQYSAYTGRVITIGCELYLTVEFLSHVAAQDEIAAASTVTSKQE